MTKLSQELIEQINMSGGEKILNTEDVCIIVDNTSLAGAKTFEELIFTAKYIKGLSNVISGYSIDGDRHIEKMFEEMKNAFAKFIGLLKESVGGASPDALSHFEDKYFRLSQDSMSNSMKLISDLSLIKEFFNRNPDSLEKLRSVSE